MCQANHFLLTLSKGGRNLQIRARNGQNTKHDFEEIRPAQFLPPHSLQPFSPNIGQSSKKEVSLQPSREKNTERFLSAHLACLLPREVFRKAKSALFVLLGWGGGRVKEDKKDKLLSISRGLIKGKNCQKFQ